MSTRPVDGGRARRYSSRVRAIAALIIAVAGCAPGSGGAVVVRWRLIDSSTGGAAAGCDVVNPGASVSAHVDHMRLRIAAAVAPDGGGGVLDCPSCLFPCAPLEWTTNFEIPEGDYRFSLEASSCGVPVGNSPPPVIRAVRRGEITNLNAIGIDVAPCTVTPAACPDGGPPIETSCGDAGV
jgi:hypothetical protein